VIEIRKQTVSILINVSDVRKVNKLANLKLSELKEHDSPQLGAADLASSLRQYLYEKYVYRGSSGGTETRVLETLHLAVAGARHD
jgi:hypothetical protein